MIAREGVQFHWTNPGYRDFADFLAAFSHDKRKKVKQERRKLARGRRHVRAQARRRDHRRRLGVLLPVLRGDVSRAPLDALPHAGVLRARSARRCREHTLLVVGLRDGRRLCAALDVYTPDTLWGRYWGTTEYVPGLHFEACYYQAIEFCIEQRHRALRRRRAGPAQARARPAPGGDALAARDRRSRTSPPRSPSSARASASTSRIRSDELASSSPVQAARRAEVAARVLIYDADHFVLPLPAGHRFPDAQVRARCASAWRRSRGDRLRVPAAATDAELARVHDAGYVAAVVDRNARRARACGASAFPWSPAMVERSRRSAGATLAACRSALDSGCGVNLAGGTHHAHRAHGEQYELSSRYAHNKYHVLLFRHGVVQARRATSPGPLPVGGAGGRRPLLR